MSQRYQRTKDLFAQAIALPQEERHAFLEQECGSDAELLAEVQALLDLDEQPKKVLATELSPIKVETDSLEEEVPEQIGPFRVIGKIASGGMGTVYEAEQDSPRRKVAIKTLRPHLMQPGFLKRFEYEAEILGQLRHPGIAHVYEAGVSQTPQGPQPYYAMEFIRGIDLGQYLEKNALGVEARLELLASLGDAVEHAHLKGIIHRDLKPANILVDDTGQVKVVDFGIARARDEVSEDGAAATQNTQAGQILGTLPYMSPEQISSPSSSLDTRSDVYSLGVIAYEVLSGVLPYDVSTRPLPEVTRIICEKEPVRLGSHRREFRGDIESIVSLALEKERDSRYGSAAAFSEDIRRYLRGEPVSARRQTTFYQLRKFAKRNRALVAAMAMAIVALISGFAISLSQYLEADAARESESLQRQEAVQEAAKAQAMYRFILEGLLTSPNPWKDYGRDTLVVDVIDSAASRVGEEFGDQPLVEAQIRHTLGATYNGLGYFAKASAQLEAALEIRRERIEGDDSDLADSLLLYAIVLKELGRYEEAEPICLQALEMNSRLYGEDHETTASAMVAYSRLLLVMGREAESEELVRDALAIRRELHGEEHPQVARTFSQLGSVRYRRGDTEEAEEFLRKALDMDRRLLGDDPYVAQDLNNLAAILANQGRQEESIPIYKESLDLYQRHLGGEHTNTLGAVRNLANAYTDLGRFDEAEPMLRETLRITEAILGADHPETLTARTTMGLVYQRMGEIGKAELQYLAVLEVCEGGPRQGIQEHLQAMYNLAWLLAESGRTAEAAPHFRAVVAGYAEAMGAAHPESILVAQGASDFFNRQRDLEEVRRIHERVLEGRLESDRKDQPGLASTLQSLAETLLALGRPEEAEGYLHECVEIRYSEFSHDDWRTAQAESLLGGCMAMLGLLDEAESLIVGSYDVLRRARQLPVNQRQWGIKKLLAALEEAGQGSRAAELRAAHRISN